jgi:hypothetical protein
MAIRHKHEHEARVAERAKERVIPEEEISRIRDERMKYFRKSI